MDRTPSGRNSTPPASEPRLFEDGAPTDTRAKILDAAFRRLATEGYAALSVREIAKDAGVNHALINYHFRTKDQLVIEVLDAANRRLLARQSAMYEGHTGFADKWAQARRFYESDLASGFVRVQAELWAASLSNPELREKFLPRLLAWKQLVLQAVREALAAAESHGIQLPPPFRAEVVACLVSQFWLGMELADLLGVQEESALHRDVLDAVQWLLESLDARTGQRAPAARKAASRKATRTTVPHAPVARKAPTTRRR